MRVGWGMNIYEGGLWERSEVLMWVWSKLARGIEGKDEEGGLEIRIEKKKKSLEMAWLGVRIWDPFWVGCV